MDFIDPSENFKTLNAGKNKTWKTKTFKIRELKKKTIMNKHEVRLEKMIF